MATLLQINCCNNVYSTGKIVSAIGEMAILNGWNSYIAYPKDYAHSANTPLQFGNLLDWYFHGFEQRIFDNTCLGLGSYISTVRLVKKIKIINPDIIHLHVVVGYYLNLNVLLKFLSGFGKPIVWTLHSCWEFTGHCTHYDYQGCYRWKNGCYECPLKNEYPQSYIFDRSSKNYEKKRKLFHSLKDLHLVTVSQWLTDELKESFLKDIESRTIYNGVDVESFKPSSDARQEQLRRKYNILGKFVAIGVASTWLPKKGLQDYFKLAQIIQKDTQIVMIGLTKSQIYTLPPEIIGIEKTTNMQELVDWYTTANVVLNLSYEESFGLTTVEGFACGTPSIVYNKTASPELVTEETGFVVNAGDFNNLLKCIQVIRTNGKSFYSKACRKRAEDCFDKNKNFMQYINLYNELLNDK